MRDSTEKPCPWRKGIGLLLGPWMGVSPARLVAVLLGPGQGLKQHVPQRQQHSLVEKQEQPPHGMEQLVQGIRELEMEPDHGEQLGLKCLENTSGP